MSRIGELTAFLRHYLAYRAGSLPNKQHVYARFRDRIEQICETPSQFIEEIQVLHRFAIYYDRLIRPDNEPNRDIRSRIHRLNILEVFTAYPFMLGIYELYEGGEIDLADFLEILDTLENYMVRRYLASEPTAYVNKMFPALSKELTSDDYVKSLQSTLTNKKYPSDNRIRQSLSTQSLYDKRRPQRLVLVMETINQNLSAGTGGHTVLNDTASIEHIMPQTMTEEWKAHIGANWDDVHRDYLHTIGNLTIVTQEWNSTLSNSSFTIKQRKLASHALLLNNNYFIQDIPKWNADIIQQRSEYLADQIIRFWPSFGEPPISVDVTGTKPTSLIILGEAFDVSSWRDVAFQMAQTISELAENFELIALEMASFFSRDDNWKASREMSNGWWLNVNLSGNAVVDFCDRLATIVGLTDDDWEFTNE